MLGGTIVQNRPIGCLNFWGVIFAVILFAAGSFWALAKWRDFMMALGDNP